MKINLNLTQTNSIFTNIAIRCPHCGHFGTFETVGLSDLLVLNSQRIKTNFMGLRKCPNQRCIGQLFFITNAKEEIIYIAPSETIPFDKENIPENVINAFEESVKCHSNNCFIASAIMIRKTLEEICSDREANGQNLNDRIKNLGGKILIPKELIEGMDDLRLLGNDAAHIKAKTYSEIGKEEIEISIDFTKEILKAVYQYENLLDKLRQLKDKKGGK